MAGGSRLSGTSRELGAHIYKFRQEAERVNRK